ncbi:zinc finger protein 271-like isoform X2 [Vespula squamosa]|uniref:Zinc finger protein 271-like isoform X2 n=1 Tax=Vespula squamosa TaxID=30214 RepID=A0ABD1ZVC5_VESSQ
MSEECPNCRQVTNTSDSRLVKDSCGHTKCRMCLLYEEQGCKTCRDLPQTSGNFVELTNDNRINTESSVIGEEIILPLELVINKNSKCIYKDTNFDDKKDIYKLSTVNTDTEKNSIKMYIPKVESCDVSSNVQMHLNNENNLVSQSGDAFNDVQTPIATKVNVRNVKPKLDPIEFVDKGPLKDKHLKSSNRSHISVIPGTPEKRKDNLNRHIRHHHTETSTVEMNKLQNLTEDANKKVLKSKQASTKHKQKGKKMERMISDVILKSPNKVSIGVTNSHEQINSRLDPMGNITPVIRTTTELSNAVPVINGPICIRKPEDKTESNKKTFTYTEPIPLAEAVVINRRIEEKLYPQNMSRHNYFLCNYLNHSDKQQHAATPPSMRANHCTKTNYSNQNGLSSETTTATETTFLCQTAESSNFNLEKDSIQHKISKEKSIGCDDIKAREITTLKKTNDLFIEVIGLKNCNSIDAKEEKQEQANCVSTIKKTYGRS